MGIPAIELHIAARTFARRSGGIVSSMSFMLFIMLSITSLRVSTVICIAPLSLRKTQASHAEFDQHRGIFQPVVAATH